MTKVGRQRKTRRQRSGRNGEAKKASGITEAKMMGRRYLDFGPWIRGGPGISPGNPPENQAAISDL